VTKLLIENKIIFTQDVPGERDWIQSQFPGYLNFETSSSGKWSTEFPEPSDQKTLHEVGYSDHHDMASLLNCNITKIKSFYTTQPDLVINDNKHWVCSDQFVSNISYNTFIDKPKFWALHIARSGTMFVEELLSKYRSKLSTHQGIGPHLELLKVFKTAQQHPEAAIVFVYRPELWETFTSTMLARRYGYHHQDNFNWSSVDPITITVEDMLHFKDIVVSTLNFWCNLRSLLPTHSMLLLNGSKVINQYRDQVSHSKVNYNKQDLISNYTESKNQWDKIFSKDLAKMLNNTVTHLEKMQCKQNLDHIPGL